MVISTAAGFAFAKIRYRGRTLVFVLVVACMFVPLPSIVIPEYINVSRFGVLDTYWGAIAVYAALGIPFSIFLMTTYFRGLSDDLIEAASIDGVSMWKMWWRLGVPLARPAMFTVAVLQFIQIWNDLLVGLLFLQNTERPDRDSRARAAVFRAGDQHPGPDGRFGDERDPADHRLPDLPAAPGAGYHDGYGQVAREIRHRSGCPDSVG